MVSTAVIDDFLAQQHLAFVGVSHDPKEFSAGVYRELKAHGYELSPVNPHADEVDGDRCVPSVAELPDGIDGAIVMVPADASAGVVQACIDRGIPR
ncbi:MAG: CoA-binding protein, partial [Nitratireductor sp.]